MAQQMALNCDQTNNMFPVRQRPIKVHRTLAGRLAPADRSYVPDRLGRLLNRLSHEYIGKETWNSQK
jgi:hypothetical protein